jgi:NAD-dependent dihydropyrimidine dehydrogenase PreA subunit
MKTFKFFLFSVAQTLLRVLPFPCRTGLIKIGNPGRNAPVLVTGNFRLTVERVRNALKGIDAYLLVANSHGVNVWCAATGGHLTNHDIVSVIKTSGVEELVDHRKVILPQLAATGIEGKVIHHKTGWKVIWGPVYAASIPEFLGNRLEKTADMRVVRFPWQQRFEMAVAWAFPISILSLFLLPFWKQGIVPLVGLVWGISFVIFMSFPLYQSRLRSTGTHVGFILFDFSKHGVPLLLWVLFMLGLVSYSLLTGFSWVFVFRWGLSSFIILLILGLDLMGSTPNYKSGLHKDRLLRVELDPELCKGAGFCEQVCPTNVFSIDHDQKMALLPRQDQCVQCGACIVQCPFDALHFRSPNGDVVMPATIRKFKLNLMGNRKVTAPPAK